MSADQFWLSEEQFAKIEPHLPRDTRGRERVDDRRVISGIIHVLKPGGRWIDAPPDYGPRKTLYIASCDGRTGAYGFACLRRWRSPAARLCN